MRLFLFCCTLFILIPLGNTLAQFDSVLGGSALIINLTPQYPNPGELVTASIEDYAINSSGSSIVWMMDGVQLNNVNNQRSITFNAPAAGGSIDLKAELVFSNKPKLESTVTIKPLYFDLIVEPQTYTPVFYQGRGLPTFGSLVNLTTLLNDENGLVDTSEYTFNWVLNNDYINGGPVKGAFRSQITVPYGRNSLITVIVQDKTGAVINKKIVALPSVPLDLRFYELNTLYGLSTKAINNNLLLVGNSTSIKAVPYYLDIRAINNSIYTKWSINNLATQTNNDDPFEINLVRGNSGSAKIGFEIKNLKDFIQSAQSSFVAEF